MAILTRETQEKVVKLLVDEGLADPALVKNAEEEAAKTNQPIIAYLASKKIINNITSKIIPILNSFPF